MENLNNEKQNQGQKDAIINYLKMRSKKIRNRKIYKI